MSDDEAIDEMPDDEVIVSHADDLDGDQVISDGSDDKSSGSKKNIRTRAAKESSDGEEEEDADASADEDADEDDSGDKHLEYIRPDITRLVVVPPITTDILSEYELAQILVIRGTQIEKTGVYFINGQHANIDVAEDLARLELAERRCPLVLRRKRGEKYFYDDDGKLVCEQYVEDWDPNKMMFPRAV